MKQASVLAEKVYVDVHTLCPLGEVSRYVKFLGTPCFTFFITCRFHFVPAIMSHLDIDPVNL